MAAWRYKIDLAGVMLKCVEQYDLSRVEEDCPIEIKELIATEISKAPPLACFATAIRNCKSIAELDRTLTKIYDRADLRLVWCGI